MRTTLAVLLAIVLAIGIGRVAVRRAESLVEPMHARAHRTGQRQTSGGILIRPGDMPAPFATQSANRPPRVVTRPLGAEIRLPAGFNASVFASGLDNPRQIKVAPNGDLFCVESSAGRVIVLRDARGTGKATERWAFASGLDLPFGLAFAPGAPYVANTSSVVRFAYKSGQTRASGPPQVVISGIPGRGYRQHWTRDICFTADGRTILVSVGSQHNVAVEPPKRAAILEYNPDGTGFRVLASGLRNAVAMATNPTTGALWCTVNERDGLGDNVPPDYVTSVRPGGFYGWPYYYIGPHHDPRMPVRPDLARRVTTPDVLLEPHSAPLGISFYEGKQFPQDYCGDAFVALHGSWNRRQRTGYKVIRIHFQGGKPVGGYQDFATGWLPSPDSLDVWGRPVGVAVARDGALFVSDDGGNCIWKITYRRPGDSHERVRP